MIFDYDYNYDGSSLLISITITITMVPPIFDYDYDYDELRWFSMNFDGFQWKLVWVILKFIGIYLHGLYITSVNIRKIQYLLSKFQ